MAPLTLGKSLLTLVALVTAIGPYAADWSETHVFNPNWPPHARFHNGQTMTTGLLLGISILYYTFRSVPGSNPAYSSSTRPSSGSSLEAEYRTYIAHGNLNVALLCVHLYYIPALSGILYPGALFTDPEFGDGHPQAYGFPILLVLGWTGWWLERGRLTAEIGASGHQKEG